MKTLIPLAAVAVMLTSCAQPGVKLNGASSQYKLTNAVHWESLADRTADDLTGSLRRVTEISGAGHAIIQGRVEPASMAGRVYYVNSQQPDSAFAKVFTPYLREALIRKGYSVTTRQTNAVVVNYDAKTFTYGTGGKSPLDYASFWTTAAAVGLALSYNEWTYTSAGIAGGLGLVALGPILDYFAMISDVTNAEVILTTSVVAGSEILYQHSETAYIKPADMAFYWSAYPETRPLETPALAAEALPVRAVRLQAN
jgi:hypothetical protein